MADIDEVILMRLTAHPDLPLFLVGHSMGGGVVLTYGYAGTHRARLAGFVVWSPMINFAPESRPWSLVTAVGKLAARLAPGKKLVNKLPPSFMSRDGDVCREFSNDPLCHNTGTLECINEMLERGKTLDSGEVSNKFGKLVPLLVAHGSGDKVTDCAASKKFVENVQVSDKTFLQYDGWFHKCKVSFPPLFPQLCCLNLWLLSARGTGR
jgi:acylglycerol lipase